MTKLLDKAIEAVRVLAPEEQDGIARTMLALAQDLEDEEGEEIDPVHLKAIDRGLEDMRQGRFATDEQVKALFRRSEK